MRRMCTGTDPSLGFCFAKTKALERFVYIHTETREQTFSRYNVYEGFVRTVNRCVKHADGSISGDWKTALKFAPTIKRLGDKHGIEAARKYYVLESRHAQLRQVEQYGFVRDEWYCEHNYHPGWTYLDDDGNRICRDLWKLPLRSACLMNCGAFIDWIKDEDVKPAVKSAEIAARRMEREERSQSMS